MPKLRYLGVAAGAALSLACAEPEAVCRIADTTAHTVSVEYGKAVELKPSLCPGVKPESTTTSWSIDRKIVAETSTYRFLACPRFKGTTQTVQADIERDGVRATAKWNVTVGSAAPKHRQCSAGVEVSDVIDAIRRGDFYGKATGLNFREAVSCLDTALEDYPCDIDVAFWAAYADLLLFAQQAPAQFFVSSVGEESLSSLVDRSVDPVIARFDLLAAEMPAENSYVADGFAFQPIGMPELTFDPGGEWDAGDALVVDALLHLFKGGIKFVSGYNGALDFAFMVARHGVVGPRLLIDPVPPESFQKELIETLEKNPRFLTLVEGGVGQERLATARAALITGLTRFDEAVTFVKGERDDQRNDIFRYFDCGGDAVCPPEHSRDAVRGDGGELLTRDDDGDGQYDPDTDLYLDRNQNGRYDPPWLKAGPDAGEADGQYSDGETIGTDAFPQRIGLTVQPLAQDFLRDLAKNLRGPDPLDLTKYLQLNQSALVLGFLASGVNIPSLRLSRWFENPRDGRDFFPLWNRTERRFFIDREEERWSDWGYDQLPSLQETVVRCPDRSYVRRAADPHGDDYHPATNSDDGCDNNEDRLGLADEANGRDFGTEGNGMFDFWDVNANGRHDGCPDPGAGSCEKAEKFADAGLWSGGALRPNTLGNGRWDATDMKHLWPSGSNVGGRPVDLAEDPRNGTLQDVHFVTNTQPVSQPLVDPVYYFFPDAQFHGVLIFDEPTVNADGQPLTHNAELMRLVSKLVQAGRQTRR